MAAIGACPEGQTNFASTVPFVFINEVSTVAAAYALSGFMTDGTHSAPPQLPAPSTASPTPSSPSPTSSTSAPAPPSAKASKATATVPQAEINSLANLLVTCVNSDGTAACAPLFSAAPALDGTPPTNTLTAILNIAHNPGANAAAIFTASLTTTPFQPALADAPNDWSLAITFYADNMAGPYFPAIDSIGNIWIPDYANSQLTVLGPTGNILSSITRRRPQPSLRHRHRLLRQRLDHQLRSSRRLHRLEVLPHRHRAHQHRLRLLRRACFFPAFDANQNLWLSGSNHTTVLAPSGSRYQTIRQPAPTTPA